MNAGAGLTRVVHEVRELDVGDRTSYSNGRLTAGEESVLDLLRNPAFAEVRLGCASPGDSVRIVGVLDAIQPCSKGPGGGGVFPGLLGIAMPVGRGETHILRGAAVLAAGYLPRAQEAVIDMSGPAAPLSPLAATHNLVVEWKPAEDADWGDVEVALRRGLVKVAAHLAEAALDAEPDAVEELAEPGGSNGNDKPRVGVVLNLQTQGKFKDVFVYGRSLSGGLPTVISPGELDDGAVVSGQYGHPALKNPTILHQTHPVVAALRASDERGAGGARAVSRARQSGGQGARLGPRRAAVQGARPRRCDRDQGGRWQRRRGRQPQARSARGGGDHGRRDPRRDGWARRDRAAARRPAGQGDRPRQHRQLRRADDAACRRARARPPQDRPARPGLDRRGHAARGRHLLRAEHARLGAPNLRGDRLLDEDRPLRQPVLRRHGRRGLRGHRPGAARRGRRARAQAGQPARRRARDRRDDPLRRRLRRLAPGVCRGAGRKGARSAEPRW